MDSSPSLPKVPQPLQDAHLPSFPFWLDGKYEVKGLLGQGGAGAALLASHHQRTLCIKLLRLDLVRFPDRAIAKFKKEFKLLKKLIHPHIGQLYDFGFDADLKRPYFVGELITGQDIYHAAEHLTMPQLEALMVQALQALHYLHTFAGQGIRHNDLKAGNILVEGIGTPNPRLKLIDFGLAAFAPLKAGGGTASFMAPEQIAENFPENGDGRKYPPPDTSTDLYSLGVLWYQCATRINPYFVKGNPAATMQKHFGPLPPAPSQINADIPAHWDGLLLKLLAKNPQDRFESAASLIQELAILSGQPYSVIPESQRAFYLPEEEWIGRQPVWHQVKSLWNEVAQGKRRPTLLRIEGERGVGKSKLLGHLKQWVQSDGGRAIFLHATDELSLEEWTTDLSRWTENFETPVVVGIEESCRAVSDALDDLNRRLQHHLQWHPEMPPKILLALTADCHSREICHSRESGNLTGSPINTFRDDLCFEPLSVQLQNFSPDELNTYLRYLSPTRKETPPASFAQKLFDHTDGNPMLVTATLKALAKQGLLFDDAGHWDTTLYSDVGIDFSKLPIPQDVSGALRDNWRRLTKPEREVASVVAVFYSPPSEQTLFKFRPDLSSEALGSLLEAGILTRRHGRITFRNSFLQRTIDQNLSPKERMTLHDRIARFLKKDAAMPSHWIAFHVAHGSPSARQKEAWKTLALFYEQSGKWADAADCYRHIHSFTSLAKCLLKLGRPDDVLTLCHSERSEESRVFADPLFLREVALAHLRKNEIGKARTLLEKTLRNLKPAEKHLKECLILQNDIAHTLVLEQHYPAAIDIYRETRRLAKNLAPRAREEIRNNDLGYTFFCQQQWTDAKKTLSEDAAFLTQVQDRPRLARIHFLLGATERLLRNYNAALLHYQECAELGKKLHDADTLMRAYNGLAGTYLDRGENGDFKTTRQQALKYFEQSLALCQHLKGDPAKVNAETAILYTNIGSIRVELGQYQQAIDAFQTVLTVLQKKPDPTEADRLCIVSAYAELGEAHRQTRNTKDAEKNLHAGVDLAKQEPVLWEHLFGLYLNWAQLKSDQSSLKEAAHFLQEAEHCVSTHPFTPTPLAQKRLKNLREIL